MEIVSSTFAQSTILKLKRIFATHGIPEVLKSDNGPPFQSHAFHQFLKDHGIQHKPSSPLWPEENGEAENFMKPLVKAVKSAHHDNQDCKMEIFNFLLDYLISYLVHSRKYNFSSSRGNVEGHKIEKENEELF